MYKVAKKTLVDLNTTKIYLLKINKSKYCIKVKIVFSVNKNNNYYTYFVKETLKFSTPDNYLFDIEDYTTYLADNCEYELIKNKTRIIFKDIEDTKFSELYLCPNPYGNLLKQEVQDLVQLNNPKLRLLPNGLFEYHEFVDNSNTARGILRDLKRLKEGKEINTRTTDECWLLRAIKALDLHWN